MTDPTRRNDPGETERLKEALFGPELAQLRTLMQRYGDDAALAESVHRVIVDVLRKAGIEDHERVAEALAPAVMDTMEQEIPRQHNRIANALLPHAGRLLVSGAGGAVTGLARGIDTVASPVVWKQRVQARIRGERLDLLRLRPELWLERMALLHDSSTTPVFSQFDWATTQHLYDEATEHPMTAGEPLLLRGGDTHYWLVRLHGLILVVAAHGDQSTTVGDGVAQAFGEFCDYWRESIETLGGDEASPILAAAMARDLEIRCRKALGTAPGDPPPRRRPWFGYGVLALVLAALIGWGAWSAWHVYERQRVVAEAEAALQADASLADLPLTIRYDEERNRLTVRGVASSRDLPERVEQTLQAAMTGKQVDVLLITPPPAPAPPQGTAMEPLSGDLAEQVQQLAGRLSAMRDQLARVSLQSWFSQQIVRFESGTDYFDPGLVEQQVNSIAELFRDWPPDYNLRVVGYSDTTGSVEVQQRVALERALAVMQALIDAGVPRERLMAVGRGAAKPLSLVQGDDSINRRVEFEVYNPAAVGG